ncbi:MAG: methyltransferase, partial [Candidatus Paceibacterota bacterium]|jgi:protein-S-isoprenylcysteine O-methyltransferase Ste14
MTFILALLAPVHGAFTRHLIVKDIYKGNTVLLEGDISGISPGTKLPVYRFNPDWKQTIGFAEFQAAVSQGYGVASYDSADFRWPMARPNEYSYITQAAYFGNGLLSVFEWLIIILVPLIYLYFFFFKNKSLFDVFGSRISRVREFVSKITFPIRSLWDLISYKRTLDQKNVNKIWHGVLMWGLHLAIVYVFASTLFGFLIGNTQAMITIGIPKNVDTFFESLKYAIWSLTILGCIFGYGYSIFSLFWGKYIRHLDFTIMGWASNAVCYPILGIYLWKYVPSFSGLDPIITGGPLFYLMLVMGLILNILYMMTIWNLGTMFGVMSDKGVRTTGFYSVVRHPSYTLEVLMFLVLEMVGFTTWVQWVGISFYFIIYWIRSLREDNFMQYANPEYVEYQKQVPYKFIPGIY